MGAVGKPFVELCEWGREPSLELAIETPIGSRGSIKMIADLPSRLKARGATVLIRSPMEMSWIFIPGIGCAEPVGKCV
jgi:hypothetical protein